MKLSIRIEDGTNISKLYKAIKEFENETKLTVLSVCVTKLHECFIKTTDEISVITWNWNIHDFMNGSVGTDVIIVEVIPYSTWLKERRKSD